MITYLLMLAFLFITSKQGAGSNSWGITETKKKVNLTFIFSCCHHFYGCHKTTTVKRGRQLSLLQACLCNEVQINVLIKWAPQSYKSLTASPPFIPLQATHMDMLSTKHNLSGCIIYCWKHQSEHASRCSSSYPD